MREDEINQPRVPTGKGINRRSARRRKVPKQIDPDACISDEESSDSVESFEDTDAYSDDEDSKSGGFSDELITIWTTTKKTWELQLPLYLRECLDMLQTPDTNNRPPPVFGLQAVTSLVRSNPANCPSGCPLVQSTDNNETYSTFQNFPIELHFLVYFH